jgi:hypothetical protein
MTSDPIITLTTDFGEADSYVAAMKGAILSINPAARLVDLSHQIPPQDVLHAALFLAGAVPCFPPGTLHLVVVDPGVGTERALLYCELAGQRLLAPDNGAITLLERTQLVRRAIRLEDSCYWRPFVSRTFHGRDILAPVAGHLSLGLDPARLGPCVTSWQHLDVPKPRVEASGIAGQVLHVDRFGNLITNIPGELIPSGQAFLAELCGRTAHGVATYGHAAHGELIALLSSSGLLEVAVSQGSAAHELGAARGAQVMIRFV